MNGILFLNLKGFIRIVSVHLMMFATHWLFLDMNRPPVLVVLEKWKSWSKHDIS
jgi:hypothetical protein